MTQADPCCLPSAPATRHSMFAPLARCLAPGLAPLLVAAGAALTRIAAGAALAPIAAGAALAQEPAQEVAPPPAPRTPEVFAALVRQAATLTALDGEDRPLPEGAAEAFITRLLAELTLGVREPARGTGMEMACVPADPREGWVCRMELRLAVPVPETGTPDTATAAPGLVVSHVAGYYLTATPPGDCPADAGQPLDRFPAYRPCAWTIADGQIWLSESR